MNVYQKLEAVRDALRAEQIVKSGTYVNAKAAKDDKDEPTYYELADFLPRTVELFKAQKLFSLVSYGKELAVLTILDIEAPESRIEFTSPMSTANVKGLHAVQNLGWAQTYLRRRLYITALELIEPDNLDGNTRVIKDGAPATGSVMERFPQDEEAEARPEVTA